MSDYDIETLQDLLKVPRDRWDPLLADLRAWMEFNADGMAEDIAARIAGATDAEVTPILIMTWRDDDIRGFNGEVTLHFATEREAG